MKNFGIIVAILVAFSLFGCASSGGSGDGAPPLVIDLRTLTQYERLPGDQLGESLGPVMRNVVPFNAAWEGFILAFPENFADMSQYRRLTVTYKYFNAAGEQITPRDSMGMIVFVYDIKGDWHGPAGPGPNTPVKEFNVMGFSGIIHKDRGIRVSFARPPQGIFIQRAQDNNVVYIELTSVVFHNGNYDSGAEVSGDGPEGT